MPLYPYRCAECGHRFEKIQSFSSKPETKCPKCGGALERLLTAPGLQFKGAGWYVNDYASKGGSTSEASNAGSKTAESKPALSDSPAKASPAPSAPTSSASASKS